MQIGVIGLGKMGANITRRLQRDGHHCVVFDTNSASIKTLVAEGAEGADTIQAMVKALSPPRAIWLMLPAGEITENTVNDLAKLMIPGDILIDGGNSFYKDDVRRAKTLAATGIHYVDVGTSGGVWGLERGFCMMIGGETDIVQHLDPIFKTLAPGAGSIDKTPNRHGRDPRAELGYIHAGPNGAGHFVKMVHNGIEYGLMQAYAEGFDVLRNKNADALPADQRYQLDMADIAEVWRRGSVISSWLLDLTAAALSQDAALGAYSGYVADSGEGRWTLEAAIEEAVPVNVLAASLFARFRSREEHTFGEKLLSAMRQEFGGHIEQGGEVKK
jgi:6-phosphogluconate dehydrogenase